MRTIILLVGICVILLGRLSAQRACGSSEYAQLQFFNNPKLAENISNLEAFIKAKRRSQARPDGTARLDFTIIQIPVVVHILYHRPGEDISNEQVYKQMDILNNCFRRQSADTANTPALFKSIAADCQIGIAVAIDGGNHRHCLAEGKGRVAGGNIFFISDFKPGRGIRRIAIEEDAVRPAGRAPE